jgi:hypothetical protein
MSTSEHTPLLGASTPRSYCLDQIVFGCSVAASGSMTIYQGTTSTGLASDWRAIGAAAGWFALSVFGLIRARQSSNNLAAPLNEIRVASPVTNSSLEAATDQNDAQQALERVRVELQHAKSDHEMLTREVAELKAGRATDAQELAQLRQLVSSRANFATPSSNGGNTSEMDLAKLDLTSNCSGSRPNSPTGSPARKLSLSERDE